MWRRRVMVGGGGVAVLVVGVYSLLWAVHRHQLQTEPICRAIFDAPTLREREEALVLTRQLDESPLGRIGRLIDGNRGCASRMAESMAKDLARLERGECPVVPLQDVPCRCGEDRWPTSSPCSKPRCVRWAKEPEIQCSGQPQRLSGE